MNKFIVIYIFLFLFACDTNECPEKKHLERIDKYFITYQKEYKTGYPVAGNLLALNLFFSDLTQIKSKAIYGDVTVYEKYSDYKEDLRKWKRWYKENRCNIKLEDLEKLESEMKLQ